MPVAETKAHERARAAFLAGTIGDALGWPMEDRANRVGGTAKVKPAPRLVAWVRREGGGYAPHEQPISAGAYSDDTQLLLAVGRSRLRGDDWYRHLVEAELPVWLLYEQGGGGALKRSARSWAYGRPPWSLDQKESALKRYFGAGGNGAAMRCMPHVLVDRGAPRFEAICAYIDADGLATHGHPRALVGSRVFAWALWWALSRRGSLRYGELLIRASEAVGEWAFPPSLPEDWLAAQERAAPEWEAGWNNAVEETLRYLAIAADSMEQGAIAIDAHALKQIGLFGKERGAGTVSAVAALFLAARYTSQPLQGLLSAAFLRNTDSDTVASMAGALLGGLAGGDWLGELSREIQDAPYLDRIATALVTGEAPAVPTLSWKMSMRSKLYRCLDGGRPGDTLELPLFGRASIEAIEDPETRGPSFVRGWRIDTELGQRIAIKRYERGRDGKPRWRPLDRPAEPPRERRHRVGLVREVADLEAACRFYEEMVGLSRERTTKSFVSFGWLALELSERPQGQLSLPAADELASSRQAIRVYLDLAELHERHRRLRQAGGPVGPLSEDMGEARFRCADPDGYVVEFRGRE